MTKGQIVHGQVQAMLKADGLFKKAYKLSWDNGKTWHLHFEYSEYDAAMLEREIPFNHGLLEIIE